MKYGKFLGTIPAQAYDNSEEEAEEMNPGSSEHKMAAIFFSKILTMRNCAEISHRYQQDKKLSTHLCLESFYDGIDGLIDDLVETYQGYYNVQLPISCTGYKLIEPAKEIREFCDYLCDNRGFCDCSFIQNQIDELVQVTAKTLYKLNFVN